VKEVNFHLFPKDVYMESLHSFDLLTAAALAERLGVKPGTILKWHRQSKIPSRKLSHKVLRFNLGDVLAALEVHQLTGREGVRS
jgi:hypothetical protein